ncbi:DUF397 domain-containing protein [Goodfellowiella coeruleoviolacea]|uniref:DUF397 domain-containing protein n=1 Tax=Goodfellowiella coeruleoviolacea TaxID=334858 RepID=A0AAE3GH75_9PSEU|nr:DUF397 domain-containing protein [Goodfellowiella coeruleoviolacea]MCP2167304.1 protein of unknown function (DUF397) [Goodfellowiella coeruleoviolacea]
MTPDSFSRWRKSSHSNGYGGACVELAHATGVIGVRDSKNPAGPVLTFGQAELSRFLGAVKLGRFAG